mgnify:CR=1 FL=1
MVAKERPISERTGSNARLRPLMLERLEERILLSAMSQARSVEPADVVIPPGGEGADTSFSDATLRRGSARENTTWSEVAVAVQTAEDTGAANLVPYNPSGWDGAIVTSNRPGTRTDDSIDEADEVYVDWAAANVGVAPVGTDFKATLTVDGTVEGMWSVPADLAEAGEWFYVEDMAVGPLDPGPHSIALALDVTDMVPEVQEGDNAAASSVEVTQSPGGEIRGTV